MKLRKDQHASDRLGRLRSSSALREVVRETRLHPADLVQPMFVTERAFDAGPIGSMPGVERLALGAVGDEAERAYASGVRAVLLFGIPAAKDETGEIAADPDGIVPDAILNIKRAAPNLAVITEWLGIYSRLNAIVIVLTKQIIVCQRHEYISLFPTYFVAQVL